MIDLALPALSQWLGAWLFPLFRLSGFFLVAPVFGMQLVPARIRLGRCFPRCPPSILCRRRRCC